MLRLVLAELQLDARVVRLSLTFLPQRDSPRL